MSGHNKDSLRFLSVEQVNQIAAKFGTPVYVYSEADLRQRAREVLAFPNPFGLVGRYAMKACPARAILQIFNEEGLHIDASSGYEVERAMLAGVPASHISLTTQELPHNLETIVPQGVQFSATSLEQLAAYGEMFPGRDVTVRINPGQGSGGTKRTNVGGPASSFGIWHEDIPLIKQLLNKHQLKAVRVHTHIGSGSDPDVWSKVSKLTVNLLDHFPHATTLNLGGGFKVARMRDEKSTDLQQVGKPVSDVLKAYGVEKGRKITLEIEPGTYLVANAASLISSIGSVKTTGAEGYKFYVINAGMTEVLRPSLYGAQHPIVVVPRPGSTPGADAEAIVCGHCCESGDILTPASGDSEALAPRFLATANVGDFLVIESVGAYCSAMPAKNYNSFPEAAEVLLREDGTPMLIRKRQTLQQILENEIGL